jgi:hypothetical protein
MKRELKTDGEMVLVALTKGYTAVIDAADLSIVKGFNWHAVEAKNHKGELLTVYAARTVRDENGNRRPLKLHRAILAEVEGPVDHRDGDGLNCRRNNLRAATNEQNAFNQRKARNNTSGLKGVSWNKTKGCWQARIRVQRKLKHLGYFNDKQAAAAAYAEGSQKFHGEFGRLK